MSHVNVSYGQHRKRQDRVLCWLFGAVGLCDIGAVILTQVCISHLGHHPFGVVRIMSTDPTPANWKYYWVPQGTSLKDLKRRLGAPDLVFTMPQKLSQTCAGLAAGGYRVPTQAVSGKVLYYGVSGAFIDSYQIFYYFDEQDKLVHLFVGARGWTFIDTS